MSEEKNEKGGKKSLSKVYVIRITVILLIALIVTSAAVVAVNPLATKYVHKAENAYAASVDDITVDESFSPLSKDTVPEMKDYKVGKKIAVISCDDRGLNTEVYFGSDRVSMRYGSGLSTESTLFGEDGASYVTAYIEKDFDALRYVERDDVIKVVTEYGEYAYTVTDYFTEKSDEVSLDEYTDDTLVLSALYPMVSDDWGNSFVVVAEKGEVQ